MSHVSVRSLAGAVVTRLEGRANTTVFRGYPTNPPTIPGDSEDHVLPYIVVMGSPGRGYSDALAQADRPTLDWSVQVTCVAAFGDDLDALVDYVHDQLDGWQLPVAGAGTLDMVNDPGPLQADTGTAPPRLFTPMVYASTTTTD